MKKYTYACDGGALMVGNDDFTVHFLNGYGDGHFSVFVCDTIPKGKKNKVDFVGSIDGKFNIYEYDCSKDKVLCKLEGRYGVYCDNGDMYLERW